MSHLSLSIFIILSKFGNLFTYPLFYYTHTHFADFHRMQTTTVCSWLNVLIPAFEFRLQDFVFTLGTQLKLYEPPFSHL